MYAIDRDPTEALPPGVAEDGNFTLRTGDTICDEWEKEIANTGSFNPFKQMSPEDALSTRNFLDKLADDKLAVHELPARLRTKR